MGKRVLLAEQHLRRGVDTNALIAGYLERMGMETRLTLTGSQLYSQLVRFQPHVVYCPWIVPNVAEFLKKRQKSVPIVNAFQEQNVILHSPNSIMAKLASESDYIFAWGEEYKKKFKELFDKPKIVLTGNPRFDTYLDPKIASVLYPSRRELACRYDLPSEKDWVLLALDFPLVFESKERLNELVDQGQLTAQQIETTRRIYRILSKWMRKLRTESSGAVVIVRPHPGSDPDQIRSDFGGESESVRFIKGGAIPPWIIAADRYITRASTSIVEAWIEGTPTSLILKKETEGAGDSRPHIEEAESSIEDYFEFESTISHGEGERKSRHEDFLSRHYYLDGCSSLRTARELYRISSQQSENIAYNKHVVEDSIEIVKSFVKKSINKYGLNDLNPMDRPNGEVLHHEEAKEKVERFKNSI